MSVERATASCYCRSVQIEFPADGDDLLGSFICHCGDCRKITASMFASGFIVKDSALKHLKGEDRLAKYIREEGIATGNTVTNHFCSVCGTLMYRTSSGFPGMTVARIGTVDNLELHSTKLKPKIEQFAKDRVEWLHGGEGVQQVEGNYFTGGK